MCSLTSGGRTMAERHGPDPVQVPGGLRNDPGGTENDEGSESSAVE